MRTVPGATDHGVVVGAGLSGLSAALQLAGRGRAVTVVERYPFPGGRMGQADIRGYRIDTGPTVLTMPDIIEDAFAAVTEGRAALGMILAKLTRLNSLAIPALNAPIRYISRGEKFWLEPAKTTGDLVLQSKAAEWYEGLVGQGISLAMFLLLAFACFWLAKKGAEWAHCEEEEAENESS